MKSEIKSTENLSPRLFEAWQRAVELAREQALRPQEFDRETIHAAVGMRIKSDLRGGCKNSIQV